MVKLLLLTSILANEKYLHYRNYVITYQQRLVQIFNVTNDDIGGNTIRSKVHMYMAEN